MNVTAHSATNQTCLIDENYVIKILEIFYLAAISLFGTVGNLMVILSVVHAKAVNKSGNVFFINLALADLLVTAICIPSIIPNVLLGKASLPSKACNALGFLLITTLASSLANLAFVAVERYWITVHLVSFCKRFSRKRIYLLVAFNWIWGIILASFAFSEHIGLGYSCNTMICSWNSRSSKAYNYLLMIFAYWVPFAVAVFFYLKLYRSVRTHDKHLRNMAHFRFYQRTVRREIRLLRTLLITICVSLVFWIPRGCVEVIGRDNVSPAVEKATGWLAISNSSINFVLYGMMNPIYRRNFKNFLFSLLCTKNARARWYIVASKWLFNDTKIKGIPFFLADVFLAACDADHNFRKIDLVPRRIPYQRFQSRSKLPCLSPALKVNEVNLMTNANHEISE